MLQDFDFMAWIAAKQAVGTEWLFANVFVATNAAQVLLIALAALLGRLVAPRLSRFLEARKVARVRTSPFGKLTLTLAALAMPVVALLVLWSYLAIANEADWPSHIVRIVASLTTAWIVIRLASTVIRDPVWARLISLMAWTMAALSTLGLYDPTISLLDGLDISLGANRISLLMVVKGVMSLAILLWVAFAISGIFENRIRRVPNLTPSVQVLFGKLTKIVLVTLAFLIAVDAVGIDLTTLAVFGGALGVGIGLGLQRIVANLVSGVTLLLDRSIKPGDVITVGDTFGWIESLGARYASVRTRDGTEHLIPNEELIVQRVENWSHTDNAVRLKIPIGVHYKADVHQAIKLCVAAASTVERVLKTPESRCLLKGFGDSSVDLELRIWIDDPTNGRSNVISEVLLNVWENFHEHGIEIPYPQRDLHLRSWDANEGQIALPMPSGELAGRGAQSA